MRGQIGNDGLFQGLAGGRKHNIDGNIAATEGVGVFNLPEVLLGPLRGRRVYINVNILEVYPISEGGSGISHILQLLRGQSDPPFRHTYARTELKLCRDRLKNVKL